MAGAIVSCSSFPKKPVVAAVRIERQHGYFRTLAGEIRPERTVKEPHHLHDAFLGNGFRHLSYGKMRGNKSYPDMVVKQNHQRLCAVAGFRLKIFRMA